MKNIRASGVRLGVDIGGTFVDLVLIESNGTIHTKKVLSTPDDYSRGVATGIDAMLFETGIVPGSIREVVHGTTIVTNACIELTGAKVGLITTKGFRDVLEIGRGRMPRLYDLAWTKPTPLAPRYMRMEVDERIDKHGAVLHPLNEDEAIAAIDSLVRLGAESIAVCLYNSPRNPTHEDQIGELLQRRAPQVYVSLSTRVMPMMKEYERTCETVVNAYVVPLVASYVRLLKQRLVDLGISAPLFVMQSGGGMITAEASAEKPIEIVECGPAAGVVGAAHVARNMGIENLIAFDLGGTTCKASIVENGEYTRSAEYEVGAGIHMSSRLRKGNGYVLRVPSIDIAEIGAGGGSILSVDSGGMLTVGPQSAGASPGPACYDKGGKEPTLTDCYVALGYMNPDYLLGGDFKLNASKAQQSMETIANRMKMGIVETAHGAYRIANSNMARAIHAVSSERGRDPRKFTLLVFGGAGALHGVEVAIGLGMKQVVIAPNGGVFCAFGLLCADIERYYVHAFSHIWDDSAVPEINKAFADVAGEAQRSSRDWGHAQGDVRILRYVDLKYGQQSSEIPIAVPEGELDSETITLLRKMFDEEHERTFGHCFPNAPLAVNAIRIVARVEVQKPQISEGSGRKGETVSTSGTTRQCYFGTDYELIETPVLSMGDIEAGSIKGPVLIDTYDTTIVVPPGCDVRSAPGGSLVVDIRRSASASSGLEPAMGKRMGEA